jgi:hypothetical protein
LPRGGIHFSTIAACHPLSRRYFKLRCVALVLPAMRITPDAEREDGEYISDYTEGNREYQTTQEPDPLRLSWFCFLVS